MRNRALYFLLALCLLLSGCAGTGESAAGEKAAAAPLKPLAARTLPEGCTALPVYLDGLLLSRAISKDGAVYVALRPICARAGVETEWSGDGETLDLRLNTLNVEGKAGRQYLIADGRYLYAPEDWLLDAGDLYLPTWALCKLLNLRDEGGEGAVRLDGRELRVLEGGEDYYDLNFPHEDLFWLSHIIRSEAGIEPLEAKIGVGNVVLNRVADPEFPNTVFDVVYDYENTIQFEPISTGTIHEDPNDLDVIAARLVLEGANTAGKCLYFVNPDFGSFWFDNNLDFVMKLGRQNFYVSRGTGNAGTNAGTDTAAGA